MFRTLIFTPATKKKKRNVDSVLLSDHFWSASYEQITNGLGCTIEFTRKKKGERLLEESVFKIRASL